MILLPLLGVIVNGIYGKKLPKPLLSFISCGVVGVSFLIAVYAFFSIRGSHIALRDHIFTWIDVGNFTIPLALLIDPLSAVMALVVTGVGFIIHVYSVGYMGEDKGYWRFFTYMNLFIFSMLMLVLSDNIFLMYVGWEGVGLCSYLLIGFWYEDIFNAIAGKKAFIVNRIGDMGFALGIFLTFVTFQTLNFYELKAIIEESPQVITPALATAITILLFIGATGKSAQIPLYVWLPDAMAGPTPVSALIHAATMVTAGVYMIGRLNFLYILSPTTLGIVAFVGIVTALYSATIGMAQNDIKRVLAYSTISQLGYMFLAMGVGAFSAGIFHLVTHAFFKALLFLAAGSIMHAMAGELDIRKMGGLRRYLPITFWTFLIATLAISGAPFFSGFFSKDEILWKSFSSPYGSPILWFIGVVTAAFTAFYMFRVLFMAFFGDCRAEGEVIKHIHESPKIMSIPLIILGILSIIGGYIGVPHSLGGMNRIHSFLEPVFGSHAEELHHSSAMTEYLLMVVSTAAAFIGFYVAYMFYIKRPEIPEKLAERFKTIYRWVLNKYFVDEIYEAIFVKPIHFISLQFWKIFDTKVIDGAVNGVSSLSQGIGNVVRLVQTGNAQSYAFYFILGLLFLAWYLAF